MTMRPTTSSSARPKSTTGIPHWTSTLLVILLPMVLLAEEPCHIFEFDSLQGYSLSGHVVSTDQVAHSQHCLYACADDPRCRSYNLEENVVGSHTCEINYRSRVSRPGSFEKREGFSYHQYRNVKDLPLQVKVKITSSTSSFEIVETQNAIIVCNASGQPSPNITWSKPVGELPEGRYHVSGGNLTILNVTIQDEGDYLCHASNTINNATSYTHLKVVKMPVHHSCLDIMRRGVTRNGVYRLNNKTGGHYPAYCDLTSESSAAWTLIESFSLGTSRAQRLPPLTKDWPINERSLNWDNYRMTLETMKAIRNYSTHWRATCSFPSTNFTDQVRVDSRDYLRGNFKDLDILSFKSGGSCELVEHVNIRGHVGKNVTVAFWQTDYYHFHADSSINKNCQFNASIGSIANEDNFGVYWAANTNFSCTASTQSTTQFWIGGYFKG